MSDRAFEAAPPCKDEAYQNHTNTFKYDRGTFGFIEELLRQEQRSKHYQEQLESRIYADSAEYQRARAYSLQLQRTVSGVQYHKSQLEASLAYMTEACRATSRDLALQRTKVQELESRLNELYPNMDLLLQKLSQEAHKARCPNGEAANGHLLLEIQRQQELIISLQSTLDKRERAIQELQSATLNQDDLNQSTIDEINDGSSDASSVAIITEKAPSEEL
ncbi:hypothetical protein N7492_009724 [Penicillium capsulatum]|uniref:Uncharacterized protein n=1 Tax=Penicillium capsulatum TaxID=69766 RepID=A0A9W9HRZ4_9EURO|nr:hypothetical protein N7492_009724 [Penicillium capsulatum]KAJ6114194.1 hypothetical protein N7512_007639 [Penicillium capsulatum]